MSGEVANAVDPGGHPARNDFHIVGVGASAGGLEHLTKPPDPDRLEDILAGRVR